MIEEKMGTNYYAIKKKYSIEPEVRHIGKSSVGWKFLFQGYEEDGIRSWEDWKRFLKENNQIILDEYDEEISYSEFKSLVEEKQRVSNPDNFKDCVNVQGYRFTYRDFS